MFLILDFTQTLRIGVVNKNILIQKELKTKKNISEILIFEIEKFLKKIKIKITSIKSIYIITGPGSFTGIRSALTFAKALKLTMRLNIYGLSKFEIINYDLKVETHNQFKCILLHFRENQFFSQTFIGNNALGKVRLINFDIEKMQLNKQTTYLYDNILLESYLEGTIFNKIKENFHLIDYNLSALKDVILKNKIYQNDPKPLYISNYY